MIEIFGQLDPLNAAGLVTFIGLLVALSAVGLACLIQHHGPDGERETSRVVESRGDEPFHAPHGSRFSPGADPRRRRHR